jgi:hypothetical protein
MAVLEYDEVFKRPIRKGDWADQLVPTYKRIAEAIAAGRRQDAIDYIEYFDVEAGVCYNLYTQWHADAERCLADKGVGPLDLQGIRDELNWLVNGWYDASRAYDRMAELARYRMTKARLIRLLGAPPEQALALLAEWKELWRSIHDRDVDYAGGLFNAIHIRFGEAAIEEMYRDYVIGNLFDFRYERFDVSRNDWADMFRALVYVSIEAMRGHLVGPERDGTMELVEDEEKVVMTFTPCGSGGRTVAGDRIAGTPSRHEAPYHYQTMQEPADFHWNLTGVCHYCTHCAVLMEKLPMERFGYPVRVVEPPQYPHKTDKCRWTMYRDPRDVPAWVYERSGHVKPGPDEPLGSRTRTGAGS